MTSKRGSDMAVARLDSKYAQGYKAKCESPSVTIFVDYLDLEDIAWAIGYQLREGVDVDAIMPEFFYSMRLPKVLELLNEEVVKFLQEHVDDWLKPVPEEEYKREDGD